MKKFIAATVLIPLASVGGCSSESKAESPAEASAPPAVTITAQPKDDAAVRAVAQEEFDTYSAGVYGETWDLWTKEGKSLISREEYMRLHAECLSLSQNLPIEIQKITLAGDKATVRVKFMGMNVAYDFLYEEGQWRFDPPADNKADYKKGADAIIAERKAKGACKQ